jgi:hypothetical protein
MQQKLLLKHQQMGHLHMSKIQQLMKDGAFGPHLTLIANCDPPLWKACLHGKQWKRPINSSTLESLDNAHLQLGD